jgi:hypothetical protein
MWAGYIWLRTGSIASFCEHYTDALDFVTDRKFLDQLRY